MTLSRGEPATATDIDVVRELIGRTPQGDFTVVVRDEQGRPVVVRNAPVLHDGTPMPTLFWLVGKVEVAEVGRLESTGAVDEVEALIGIDAIDAIHRAYEQERLADMPASHAGHSPSGGVGGTRRGVKCLHAHLAHWLAGGDDAVGEWTARKIAERGVSIAIRVSTQ